MARLLLLCAAAAAQEAESERIGFLVWLVAKTQSGGPELAVWGFEPLAFEEEKWENNMK